MGGVGWEGGRGRSPPPPSGASRGAVIEWGGLQRVVERAVEDTERGNPSALHHVLSTRDPKPQKPETQNPKPETLEIEP